MNRAPDPDAAGTSAVPAGDQAQSDWAGRLAERRRRHRQRGKLYRAGVVALGALITLAGVILSGPGVPGPGFLIIPIGLGLLALEFTWAERLLGRAIAYAERQKRRAAQASRKQKLLSAAVAAVALAAFVIAAVLWDIPLLPVV